MDQQAVEATLISSLKTPEHLNLLKQKYKFTQNHFSHYPAVATFIWDYIVEYGESPDQSLISITFPDFPYKPVESIDYIAEEFRKNFVRSGIFTAVEGQNRVIDDDPESALVGLISQFQNLQRRDSASRVVVDSNASSRFEEYKLRADGITNQRLWWGIDPFDNFPVMMMRGQMVGLIADTKVGKSWLGLKIALNNYLKGHKVVIISPELSRELMEARIDVILAYESGFPISHEKLMQGIPGIEENYQKYLSTIDRSDLVFYTYTPSDRFTVSSVASIIKTDKPDIVLVDGIYLMQDEERGSQSWEQIRNLCRGLKTLATEANVALLVTNQTARQRDNDENLSKPAQASSVAYGYDFNRFVDILVSIGGASDSPNVREVAIPLIRSGRPVQGSFKISFDTDSGDIGYTAREITPMALVDLEF